jgi:hypothetical protein
MRLGGAIRGCEEYWMRRMRVERIVNSELQVVAPSYVNYGPRWLGLNEQALSCVLAHTRFFGVPQTY